MKKFKVRTYSEYCSRRCHEAEDSEEVEDSEEYVCERIFPFPKQEQVSDEGRFWLTGLSGVKVLSGRVGYPPVLFRGVQPRRVLSGGGKKKGARSAGRHYHDSGNR